MSDKNYPVFKTLTRPRTVERLREATPESIKNFLVDRAGEIFTQNPDKSPGQCYEAAANMLCEGTYFEIEVWPEIEKAIWGDDDDE
jgi:hypothetical protein